MGITNHAGSFIDVNEDIYERAALITDMGFKT
jgi:hypothetical protein